MTAEERMMEVAKLRLRFRMNNRLRLESLAMLSKLFREHQEPIGDELLSCIVFAVPEELLGEGEGASGATATILVQNPPSHPPRKTRAPHPPTKNPPPHHLQPSKKNRPPFHPHIKNPPSHHPQPPKGEKKNRPPSHPPVLGG